MSEIKMLNRATFEQLVRHIKEYESDTFTAEGFQLTNDEAIAVAEQCIRWMMEYHMDGVILDEFLYNYRCKVDPKYEDRRWS